MKSIYTFLLIVFVSVFQAKAQCNIDPFIENNYTNTAKIMALREIQSDPQNPDYDNPIIPEAAYIPYLENLSTIYENYLGSETIDSLFNEFEMKANAEYSNEGPVHFKEILLVIPSDVSWLADFKNTGVSGVTELDDLMNNFNFDIESQSDLNICNCSHITLRSSEVYNMEALKDDFLTINGISEVETIPALIDRFNYNGINYTVNNAIVEVADIEYNNNVYTFTLYSGDCWNGCTFEKSWDVEVDSNCQVVSVNLDNEAFQKIELSLYPNPVNDNLFIASEQQFNAVSIFSISGQEVLSLNKNQVESINLAQLPTGVYFVKLTTPERNSAIKRIIKN